MTDRKKPSVAFWATVVLVVVFVGYPLSFGPACWAMDRGMTNCTFVTNLYRPFLSLTWSGPEWISVAILEYANLYSRNTWTIDPVGSEWIRIRGKF